MVEKFDWAKGWKVFRERFGKRAPEIQELEPLVVNAFQELWSDITPLVGIEQSPNFSVDKDGKLKANWMGWLLLDIVAAVAISEARKRAKKDFDKSLNEALVRINDRFRRIEEYIKFPLAE